MVLSLPGSSDSFLLTPRHGARGGVRAWGRTWRRGSCGPAGSCWYSGGWQEGGTGGPAASPQGSTDSAPALSALLGPWGAKCAPELGSLLPLLRPFPFTEGSSALRTLAPRVFRVRSSGKTCRGDAPTSWEPGDQAQLRPHCLLLASVLLGAHLLRARVVGEGRKEMEGPEGRAGVSGVLVQWPARGLPCRIFSVSGTQCAAVALHKSGCFWGWRLVSVLNADPREAASWSSHAGVCPLLFSPLFVPSVGRRLELQRHSRQPAMAPLGSRLPPNPSQSLLFLCAFLGASFWSRVSSGCLPLVGCWVLG